MTEVWSSSNEEKKFARIVAERPILDILEMHEGTIDLVFHLWDHLKLWGLEILQTWGWGAGTGGQGQDQGGNSSYNINWLTWLGTRNMWPGSAAKSLWPVMSPDHVCICTPPNMFAFSSMLIHDLRWEHVIHRNKLAFCYPHSRSAQVPTSIVLYKIQLQFGHRKKIFKFS